MRCRVDRIPFRSHLNANADVPAPALPRRPQCMDLDAHTIDNLNLLADEEGDERGSVLALLRHCVVRRHARTCESLMHRVH